MMAAKNPLSLTDRPHQLFADAPPPQQPPAPSGGVAPPPPPPVQQMGQGHMPGDLKFLSLVLGFAKLELV